MNRNPNFSGIQIDLEPGGRRRLEGNHRWGFGHHGTLAVGDRESGGSRKWRTLKGLRRCSCGVLLVFPEDES